MNARRTNLLLSIFMIAATATVASPVQGGNIAAPVDPLVNALKPGMTFSEAVRAIKRLRAGDSWGDQISLNDHYALCRYSLGDGTYLLAEYKDVADPIGNLHQNDKLSAVEVVRFADLKKVIPDDLFEAVRLIHLSPSIVGSSFDPTALVRTTNHLYSLGKEKALGALRAYDALGGGDSRLQFRYDLDVQRIFLVLRVLFVRMNGDPLIPWTPLGGTSPNVAPDDKDWPLFPLTVWNDIPFCLCPGYSFTGPAPQTSVDLDYCDKNCNLRKSLLCPSSSPFQAAQTLCASEQWRRLFKNNVDGEYTEYLLRLQAIRAASNVIRRTADERELNPGCVSRNDAERVWTAYLRDDRLANISWDGKRQNFVARNALDSRGESPKNEPHK